MRDKPRGREKADTAADAAAAARPLQGDSAAAAPATPAATAGGDDHKYPDLLPFPDKVAELAACWAAEAASRWADLGCPLPQHSFDVAAPGAAVTAVAAAEMEDEADGRGVPPPLRSANMPAFDALLPLEQQARDI